MICIGRREMRKLITLFLLLVLPVVLGCAMQKHRKYVRDGLLVTGLNREAFLFEWGPPDRTQVITGEEVIRAGWRFGEGFFTKGKQTYDVWIYEKKGVELLFYGVRLAAWKTEKSVEELKALTPPENAKPQTLDEYTKERKKGP